MNITKDLIIIIKCNNIQMNLYTYFIEKYYHYVSIPFLETFLIPYWQLQTRIFFQNI